ncbi:MAG: MerR family transcriptional regulator [Planctomycetota bacterium]|jgi:methanogenic corrinoid protein MtbC1
MSPATDPSTEDLLSIGDLAEAAGVTPDTLRMWERRYGRPEPVRLPSGHRRYTRDQVRWLRRVAEALSMGHRPGTVVRASEDDLERLLAPLPEEGDSEDVKALLLHVPDLTNGALDSALRTAATTRSVREFVEEIAGPLLIAIGREWADGRLQVRHEHHASQVLEDVLRWLRGTIEVKRNGPLLLHCTLSGEIHGLGVQLAALSTLLGGGRASILGADTPNEEIQAAVTESGADGVIVSVSLATGGIETDRQVAALRKMLPDSVALVIGGRGARGIRRGPRGVIYLESLGDLEDWVRERTASKSS